MVSRAGGLEGRLDEQVAPVFASMTLVQLHEVLREAERRVVEKSAIQVPHVDLAIGSDGQAGAQPPADGEAHAQDHAGDPPHLVGEDEHGQGGRRGPGRGDPSRGIHGHVGAGADYFLTAKLAVGGKIGLDLRLVL